MCGIVGYVGPKSADTVVVEGLRRLEYRGYDSAGVALVDDGRIVCDKRAGKLANLDKALAETPLPASHLGIGHTRWATHGAPTDENAHPHLGARGRVALVHNGIIENFAVLRTELERLGHEMRSETDTEVAAHLLENLVEGGADLTTAMQQLCGRLEGAFTLVAVDSQAPDRVVAARRNSPLVVGLGEGVDEVRQLAGPLVPDDDATVDQRDAGGVVAAVLQPAETVDHDVESLFAADVSHDAAHGPQANAWASVT